MNHNSLARSYLLTRPVHIILGVALLGGLTYASPRPALAATTFLVNVRTDGADLNPGDGICDTSAAAGSQCALRAAIMEANARAGDDTITLPAGTLSLSIPGANEDGGTTGDLDVLETLTVTGAGAGKTFIDAGLIDRALDVHFPTERLVLNKLAVQRGAGETSDTAEVIPGAGIRAVDTAIRLNQSIIANNLGSGLFAERAQVTVSSSSITNNRVFGDGGGIFARSTNLQLVSSVVSNNTADFGQKGGGLYLEGTTASLLNTVVNGNIAHWGGGIYQHSGTLGLYNVSIFDNLADAHDPDMDGNVRSGRGGGLYLQATTTMRNSLVAHNTRVWYNWQTGEFEPEPDACSAGTITSGGYNLIAGGCSLAGDTQTNLLDKDPRLVIVQGRRTPALRGDSPAIDAGHPNGCTDPRGSVLTVDRRGVARPFDGNSNNGAVARCDIGAYEFTGPLLSRISPQSVPAGQTTLTVILLGKRFTATSVVRWNGMDRPTQFLSATTLKAQLSAADLGTIGTYQLTVYTPGTASATSNPRIFQVTAP